MELFDLMLRIWRLNVHIGLAWERPEPRRKGEQEEEPPGGPMPRLEPVDEPWPVVLSDDEPELQGSQVGFR